jgi:hypothetical protein
MSHLLQTLLGFCTVQHSQIYAFQQEHSIMVLATGSYAVDSADPLQSFMPHCAVIIARACMGTAKRSCSCQVLVAEGLGRYE